MSGTNGTSGIGTSGPSGRSLPIYQKNVQLTLDYSKSTWTATLSSPLAIGVRLTNTTVFGWKTNATCVGGIDASAVLNMHVSSNAVICTSSDAKLNCLIHNYRISPNIIVNGVSLGNGQKVAVGQQILTVAIQHVLCSPYVCS